MRGEGTGGMHGGNKRRWRHSLGKHWREYHGKLGGGDRARGTHSMVRGYKAGAGERGFRYSGMETGDAQVGG